MDELLNLHGKNSDRESIESELNRLVQESVCFEHEGYYAIQSDVEALVHERHRKEALAESYIKKLPFYSRIIKSFPFVRGLAISGSLSKRVMHDDGDIDYFIITKKNRLWICRSLLILFKKIFLLNSRKYFCVNYFVDEDNLIIRDKNIFTAIEVSYLIPVYNSGIIGQMKEENNCVKEYFPSFSPPFFFPPIEGQGGFKNTIEALFFDRFADRLDLLLMKLTFKRWEKKFSGFNPEKLELTMRSNRGISKHHPSDYQTKVLDAYSKRIDKLKTKHESPLYS